LYDVIGSDDELDKKTGKTRRRSRKARTDSDFGNDENIANRNRMVSASVCGMSLRKSHYNLKIPNGPIRKNGTSDV
jgi:hypothetical protein